MSCKFSGIVVSCFHLILLFKTGVEIVKIGCVNFCCFVLYGAVGGGWCFGVSSAASAAAAKMVGGCGVVA